MCHQVEMQGYWLQDCSMSEKDQAYCLLSEEWLHVDIQVLSASAFCLHSTLYGSLQTIKEIYVGNRLILVAMCFLAVIMYSIQLTCSYRVGPAPLERTLPSKYPSACLLPHFTSPMHLRTCFSQTWSKFICGTLSQVC